MIDDSSSIPPFRCFEAKDGIDPCSANPCMKDVSSIFPHDNKENVMVKVQICSDADTNHQASIWELNFSRTNDSTKIEGNIV